MTTSRRGTWFDMLFNNMEQKATQATVAPVYRVRSCGIE
nr:MAG TPA: hypothetical protein [Caudoviricetes sp.]DAP73761.1 MAG TPA: hypothetical protein [Caudoviricetes sp.]